MKGSAWSIELVLQGTEKGGGRGGRKVKRRERGGTEEGGLQRNTGTHPRVVVANKTVMLPVEQPIGIDKGSFLLITERRGHQSLSQHASS